MKKTLVVAAVAGLFASAANAQSSVTLYGLIDASVAFTNNINTSAGGGQRYAMGSGLINGSRWGLRGSEDLGGGLKAIFQLENGFNINNGAFGQQGREFGRQAFVGLSSNQFGTLTVGRQYDSVVDYLGPLSLTGTGYGGTVAAHPYDNDNLDNSIRISNSVKYTSVNYNGLKFGGLYGFSNQADGFATNRAYSAGVSYAYAGFNFAAGYLQLNNSLGSSANLNGAVSDAPISAARERVYGAGLNYAFGPAVVGFVFTQSKYDNAGVGTVVTSGVPAGAYVRFNNYELNARYNITPAWNVAAQYTFTQSREPGFLANGSGEDSPKFHTATVMSTYSLSKRTDVYGIVAYTRFSGTNYLGGATINGGGGASSTNKQVLAGVGIRHRF